MFLLILIEVFLPKSIPHLDRERSVVSLWGREAVNDCEPGPLGSQEKYSCWSELVTKVLGT